MKKNKEIVRSVRFTEAEWQQIETAAMASIASPGTFVREAALRSARRVLDPGDDEMLNPHTELLKRVLGLTLMAQDILFDRLPDDDSHGRMVKIKEQVRDYMDRHDLY